jgi:hypothetical protein
MDIAGAESTTRAFLTPTVPNGSVGQRFLKASGHRHGPRPEEESDSVRPTSVVLPLALALLSSLGGCAVVDATRSLASAEVAMVGARAAGADKTAPYEYTAADAHFQKAREENSRARYGDAVEHARKAAALADQARAKASAPAVPEGK